MQLFYELAIGLVLVVFCCTASASMPQDPTGSDNRIDTVNSTAANKAIQSDPQQDSRHFEFTYGASIDDIPAGAKVKIWFPVAESNFQQTVSVLKTESPTAMSFQTEATNGNRIGFFEQTQENEKGVEFEIVLDVLRKEANVDSSKLQLDAAGQQQFLAPNSLVPITGKPIELLKSKKLAALPLKAGRQLYELVGQHMTYDKSKPGYGNGDSNWACDSRTGNCTDFHSLFISLARSKNIPAKFEIGFPIPADKKKGQISGYHCWAWFFVAGQGWQPVDISEADKHPEMKEYYFGRLTRDRVAFSTGRDIELIPKSESGPLNYFIYPHVEVDGVVWPKEKINLRFSFSDIE